MSKTQTNSEYQAILLAKGPELPHPRDPKECSGAIRMRLKEQTGG